MNDRHIDEETLAAFLDGTLTNEERSNVLSQLVQSPSAYEEFLDAARIADSLRETTPSTASNTAPNVVPNVVPRRTRTRWRSLRLGVPLLAAASIAGVVLWPRTQQAPQVIALVQQLPTSQVVGTIEGTLGPSWDQLGWSVVRGKTTTQSTGLAARVGALYAMWVFAKKANDSTASGALAARVADLLASTSGAGSSVRALTGTSRDPHQQTTIGIDLRSISGDSIAFDVGAWLSTTRIALALGDARYLSRDAAPRRTLTSIRQALDTKTSVEWDECRRNLGVLDTDTLAPEKLAEAVAAALKSIPL